MGLLEPRDWTGKIYIGGWVDGGGAAYPVIEPATGEELGQAGRASVADVARATELAAETQRAWAAKTYDERAAVLRRAGDLWFQHADEERDWIVRESGSIPGKADFEIYTAAQECYEAAALASQPYGELLRSNQPRLSLVRRLPVGVVGVISPFNAPVILSIRAVAPALALGNSVVLKPDPRTAVCGGYAVARILEEAGLPPGVLSVIPGGADVGEALVTDARVRVVAFTGSTRAGRIVGRLAAEHLKRVHLELGGNSAMIVLDDVDLDQVVSVAAWGSFFHQGQICMTTGRHIVDARIADAYASALAERANHLLVGNPATEQVALGPIIDERQRDHIHELVTSSVSAGAKLAAGGTFEGLFYRPTVLTDVPPTAPAYDQEVFGPVAPIIRFNSIDEAVKLACDTEYGLSLSILTKDVMKALEIADRIPTGLVHINDQTVNDEATIPFGGVKDSGTGARHGGAQANLDSFTDAQWVTIRRELASYPF